MPPSTAIFTFHEQLLSLVCEGSTLGSIPYHGGPLDKCPECPFDGVVPYVRQPNDKSAGIPSTGVKCPSPDCSHIFDIDELLGWKVGDSLP